MKQRRSRFDAIGTKWDLQIHEAVSDEAWQGLLRRIYARIQAFDSAYSRFRSDSLVTKIATVGGTHTLQPDAYAMLKFYEQLYDVSDGKVTPLIGQTIADAGYDATYSFDAKDSLTQPPHWEDVLTYDERSLTVREPVLLDFGAAGKGYLIDIVAGLVTDMGLQNLTINAGGDMLHRSTSATELEVGMENPLDTSEAIGVIQLGNQSLCASSGSKRHWDEYTHIIDPIALESPKDVMATWVIADDTMTADGLATALFFTKPAVLQQRFTFSYALLTSDMALVHDQQFPVTAFTA